MTVNYGDYVTDDDLLFEDDVQRNRYSVKAWLNYVEHKKDTESHIVNLLFERALKNLPGSYKLWHHYTLERQTQTKGLCCTDRQIDALFNVYDRCFVYMNKMPRLWLEYCQCLVRNNRITRSRHAFDRALKALPITQHSRIWKEYITFINLHGKSISKMAIRVYNRYLQLEPENIEKYYDFLIDCEFYEEAAQVLIRIINDEHFCSKNSKTKFQLWNELCQIISKYPEKMVSIDVDAIMRYGISKYTDQIGLLWNSLANYYIRGGNFQKARDIYHEAIETVKTSRDFSQVFDTFVNFEEQLVSTKMNKKVENVSIDDEDYEIELEILLGRLESLIEDRPLLLNSVLLRQNPHNVVEWQNRARIFESEPEKVIYTYEQAIKIVDIRQSIGSMQQLWIDYAIFYHKKGDSNNCNYIFERAIMQKFRKVDDLASVWCEWVELLLKNDNHRKALSLLQRAITPGSVKGAYHDEGVEVQNRVYKSLRLWLLYADCEEMYGTIHTVKAVYYRIMDLRIANPQTIINFAQLLESHYYFEESFKCYERGIAIFKWPNVCVIWSFYIKKFILRYGGSKLERLRDLFEQCLESCPVKYNFEFYVLYAFVEEKYGIRYHAPEIYERALESVPMEHKYQISILYLNYMRKVYSITNTRKIFQKSIEIINDDGARKLCQCYAEMEAQLGEIDRSRTLYVHCAQMCDPRIYENFWSAWKKFELKYGNEDTMREMLRVKRSVMAYYQNEINAKLVQAKISKKNENSLDDMSALDQESQIKNLSNQPIKDIIIPSNEIENAPDEYEIDVDMSDSDKEIEKDIVDTTPMSVPSEVFGSLKLN